VTFGCAVAAGQHSLQYRLQAGDHASYQVLTTVTTADGSQTLASSAEDVQVWCLGRQGDQLLILLDATPSADGPLQLLYAAVFSIDESGRARLSDEILSRLAPLEGAIDLLPMLPLPVQGQMAWTTPTDPYGRQWRCTSRGADRRQSGHLRVDFQVDDLTGVAEVLGRSRRGRYWFDPILGCLSRLEVEEQDDRRHTRSRTVAGRRELLRHGPAWAARRGDEAQRFLQVLRHEDRLLAEITARPDQFRWLLDQLDRLWLAFQSDLEPQAGSPFMRVAQARRAELSADASRLKARAELARRWLNQPARPWTLQDALGRTVTSESIRRGVVIECFWSSDSVWALRVLWSLSRWQDQPGSPAVPLVCYNLDPDPAAARRAIEICRGRLTQILGGPLRTVEPLPELPVVRVLDRDGWVRGIWVGWDPAYAAARALAARLSQEEGP